MVPYISLILCLQVNFGAILAQGSYLHGSGYYAPANSQSSQESGRSQPNGMTVLYEWKSVDYTWPSSKARDMAVKQGRYDPTRVAILDVDIYDPAKFEQYPNAKQKIFVTTPKFQPKIPVTLSTVSSKRAIDGSYLLEPFPNWSAHSEKDCEGLISVYRVQVDECGKLWVLDTGKLYTFTNAPQTLCSPQIVVYDLKKGNKVVTRHRFPDSVLEASSLPITIAVDTRDQCASQFAYCADVMGYQLLVFDATRGTSWRVQSNYFHPFPNQGAFSLNGAEFDLMDGVFAIALGPLVNHNRRVYFHALASVKEGWTYASTLLNQSLFDNNLTPTALFELSQYDRNSQSTVELINDEGIMFFPLLISNSLACWNTKTVYKQENFATVYKSDQLFQFLSGMKLKDNRDLYFLTSRLQNYIVTSVTDVSQVNYRVLTARTADLTRKTSCDVTSSTSNTSYNNWGYEVIENLIEDEKQQSQLTNRPPGKYREPTRLAPIRVANIDDSHEDFKRNSQGQQSEEKPLRMYYTNERSDEDHSRSIENYIDAHLPQSHEFDTHEQYEYIKRRNSMEDGRGTHKEFRNVHDDIDDAPKVKSVVGKSNPKVRIKIRKLGRANKTKSQAPKAYHSNHGTPKVIRRPIQKQTKVTSKYKQKYVEEIPRRELSGKNSVESMQRPVEAADVGNVSPHEFDSSEMRTLIENDTDMRALLAASDMPNYHHVRVGLKDSRDSERSSKEFKIASAEFNGTPIRSSTVHSTLDKRKRPPSGPNQLLPPYQAQFVTTKVPFKEGNEMYSLEMLYNNEPSNPIVFKTNLRQKHAPSVQFGKSSSKVHQGKLGYPLKSGNCKQMFGKGSNDLLCRESVEKMPAASSYQQQEFFRSSGT